MKEPVGTCRYCGQEFMRKQSLAVHEAERCPQRPLKESVEQEAKRPFWSEPQEAQTRSRAITQMGAGIKVWRPGHG